MTPDEIADLLGRCALFDYRFAKPDVKVAAGWYQLLRDLEAGDAMAAVDRYYATNTDRIMPAHIRLGVKEIQNERRRNTPVPERALPSRFERDINRDVRMAEGASTVRGVLGPLLETIAARQKQLPSAMDELRALTAGPDVIDAEVTAEEVFE